MAKRETSVPVRVCVYVDPPEGSAVEYLSTQHGTQAKQILRNIPRKYGKYGPIPDFDHGGTFTLQDAGRLMELLTWLQANVPNHHVVAFGLWDTQTLRRARWVPLAAPGEPVDCEVEDSTPLNRWKRISCSVCKWPDEKLQEPYFVRSSVRRSSHEIFLGVNGIAVVRSRVRELLERVAADQLDFAPVAIAGRTRKVEADLFAMRPLHLIQSSTVHTLTRCPSCHHVRKYDYATNIQIPLLNRFGPPEYMIARTEPWMVSKDELWSDVIMAGELFAYLYNHSVKGLLWPREGGYLSSANESPITTHRFISDDYASTKDRMARKKWQLR